MRTGFFFFMMIAVTAQADLDVWTGDHVIFSIPVDSTTGVNLIILSQYQGWGYSSSFAMLISSIFSLPDSFSIDGDVLVSHSDYLDTLETAGFMQVLNWSSIIELDTISSRFPDTLALICIASPFRAQPESLRCTWVLSDSLYHLVSL